MTLVIDASALIEVLTVNPKQIPDLVTRVQAAEWMNAPHLLDYELHSVLRKLVAREAIPLRLAEDARGALQRLRIGRYPLTSTLSARVWELRHSVSAHDAAYVALAEELAMPLVTTDRRLADGLKGVSDVTVESY